MRATPNLNKFKDFLENDHLQKNVDQNLIWSSTHLRAFSPIGFLAKKSTQMRATPNLNMFKDFLEDDR